MGLVITVLSVLAYLVVFLVIYFAYVLHRRAKYYKKQGIPYGGASLSRIYRIFSGALNFITMEEEVYKELQKTDDPIVAVSDTGGSTIYVKDLDLLRKIMVRDFDHFVNQRPFNAQKSSKYLTKMLFVMNDDQWKSTRAKMTPAFTTGKIKRMFKIFQNSAERLDRYIKEQIEYPKKKSMDVDFVKILFKYSMDVIANCAFGVESNGWELPMEQFSEFERNGKLFEFRFDPKIMIQFVIITLAPKIADMLELDLLHAGAQKYFVDIIRMVLKQRRESGDRREDFLQLMMDIQQGTLKAEEGDEETKNQQSLANDKFVFDDDYLIANALMFFLGGFDTTQTALLFTVYSLALNPEVQEKLYKEVKGVMDKNDGHLTYEGLSEMPYLGMAIDETLRLYPASARTERLCTQDYYVQETGFTIEKGSMVGIPIHGIHNDPKFYPNPQKYDPERFSPENKAKRHQYAYLPFGHGPRSCPGVRFALTNVKAVIAQVVYSYKLEPCSKTQIPMEYDASAAAKPKGAALWLRATVRE